MLINNKQVVYNSLPLRWLKLTTLQLFVAKREMFEQQPFYIQKEKINLIMIFYFISYKCMNIYFDNEVLNRKFYLKKIDIFHYLLLFT